MLLALWSFVLVLLSGASATIVFTVGPVDMQANDGESVLCPCEYTGTDDLPFWRINDTSYIPTYLPYGYIANETGLVFTAFPYLNNTSFQCYFVRYNTTTGDTYEILSGTGVVRVFVGENSTSPEAPLELCKPENITAITVSSQGSEINFTWVESAELHCKDFSYTAQLTTCAQDSREFAEPCTIKSNTTYLEVHINTDCQGLDFNQSLAFRVRSDGCQSPDDSHCYTSYHYLEPLSDTDQRSVLVGTGFVFKNISNEICTMPFVCVKTTETPGICATKPEDLAERLPGGYTLINEGRDLYINDVRQSLEDAVHTISCVEFISCSMGPVEKVTNNFQLTDTRNDSTVKCSLDVLGSINGTVDQICTRKGLFGGRRVANGMVCYTGNFNGSNATYFCDDGYHVEGSNTETCEASGEWSDNKTCTDIPVPSCPRSHISMSGSTAEVTCEGYAATVTSKDSSYIINYMDEVDMWEDCSCPDDTVAWIVTSVVVSIVLSFFFVIAAYNTVLFIGYCVYVVKKKRSQPISARRESI